jgi:uncharacterized membrane protein YkvA (DUF1232 family)
MNNDKNINNFDFEEHLYTSTKDYNGKYKLLIRSTSKIFALCCHLVYESSLKKKEKILLYKSIAYFVLPRDVFSEATHGSIGFIDDMMLCLYALNLISKRHGEDILYEIWSGRPSTLKKLLNEEFEKVTKENNKMFESVLIEVGVDNN